MDDRTLHRKARLKELIDAPPFFGNQAEFARRTGLSKGRIHQLLDPNEAFGERSAVSLARRLDLTPLHFDLGFEKGLQSFLHRMAESQIAAQVGTRRIPLISYAQAGKWATNREKFQFSETDDWLVSDQELSGEAFALRIEGNSMLPYFNPGDRVIIDPEIVPHPGDFVAAKSVDEVAFFMKYRPRHVGQDGLLVFDLVPLNEDYPSLSSSVIPIQIIGTMMEHRKYRNSA